jgi:hypothetical protein
MSLRDGVLALLGATLAVVGGWVGRRLEQKRQARIEMQRVMGEITRSIHASKTEMEQGIGQSEK